MRRCRIPKRGTMSDLKGFELRYVTEGEHTGKLGIFEGSDLVGLAPPRGNDEYARSNEILLAAEGSKSPARRQLAKLIRERMEGLGESFALAELSIVRTGEGRALGEKARKASRR